MLREGELEKTFSRGKGVVRAKPIGVSRKRSESIGVKVFVKAMEDVIDPQGEADRVKEGTINREIGDVDIFEEVVGVELVVSEMRRVRSITEIIAGMIVVVHKRLVNRISFQRREMDRELFG